ncbi:hypothetical protein FBEOM_13764 [Fusarium beomiforme]|uniref:2EXR domain-containing protein n=1 Tax=Fusarium beomiforme TaxID=44412 RepID=A0A9P5A536_9HYPO|nr:hypothetical protein FBEOM_13764 [Fusarium beomiforme]
MMFTLFPHLPPELRDQIWYHALSEPRQPSICFWKKGCWIPKYLTPEDWDYDEKDPNNIRLEFRYDKLTTPFSIPFMDVNLEARRAALSWARGTNIPTRYRDGKYHFKQAMNNDTDAMYIPLPKLDDFEIEAMERGFEPDMIQRNHGVETYVTRFAISEELFDVKSDGTTEEVPETWEWYCGLRKIYVIVGEQPNENDQWEIDTETGRSLFWTNESGVFELDDCGEDICDVSLYERIIDDKVKLGDSLRTCHGWREDFRFEIRVCKIIRR